MPKNNRKEGPQSLMEETGISQGEALRAYQRAYYQKNKEKAKDYQRQYNITHRRKDRADPGTKGRGRSSFTRNREAVKFAYTASDIMHMSTIKSTKLISQILKGEKFFVG